jgi:tripartite-type tricarboxylate transporter receptor subunit TctC
MKLLSRLFSQVAHRTALVAVSLAAATASAAWPEKPIKLIVPYPAGGTTDVLARSIGQKLGDRLGQPVIIENRAGAGGTLGSAVVANSPPDGYTLVLGTVGSHAVNYALNEKLAYHPLRDFVGVIPIASVPNVLVVRAEAPYKTFGELMSAARARPGTLTHGSTGIGASPQLSLEVLKMMGKVDINDIMYKGSAPVMIDLLGGQVTMAFDGVATSIPHIKAGKLRPLAVSSKTRVKALPDVPTIGETFAGFDVVAWYAIWAPASTPAPIVKRLNAEIDAILKTPELQERMAQAGAEVIGGSVEAFAAMHKQEFDRWYAFIKQTGIKTE